MPTASPLNIQVPSPNVVGVLAPSPLPSGASNQNVTTAKPSTVGGAVVPSTTAPSNSYPTSTPTLFPTIYTEEEMTESPTSVPSTASFLVDASKKPSQTSATSTTSKPTSASYRPSSTPTLFPTMYPEDATLELPTTPVRSSSPTTKFKKPSQKPTASAKPTGTPTSLLLPTEAPIRSVTSMPTKASSQRFSQNLDDASIPYDENTNIADDDKSTYAADDESTTYNVDDDSLGLVGVWSDIPVNSSEAERAAQFAVNTTYGDTAVSYKVIHAESQVVAGINYNLTIDTELGLDECKSNIFEVYDRFGNMSITSNIENTAGCSESS